MWGNTNKLNAWTPGAGAAGTEIDLSACTAAPSGLPSALTSAKAICVVVNNPEIEVASRKVHDELQAVFNVARAAGAATMDVRVWAYMPEYKRDTTAGLGTWKALRLLPSIPRDEDTTDDTGTVYRIPVPAGCTHLYFQRVAVSVAPDTTEVALYGTEELD